MDVLAVVLKLVGVLGLLDCDVRVSAEWEGATFCPGMLNLPGSSGRETVDSNTAFSDLE